MVRPRGRFQNFSLRFRGKCDTGSVAYWIEHAHWVTLGHCVNSMTKRMVLLPGLDGTGRLFAAFLAALPTTIITTVVTFPAQERLSYCELSPFVSAAVPKTEPFALLADLPS